MDGEVYKFSLATIEIPFQITNKQGIDEDYILIEADGEAGSAYRDAKMAGMKAEVGDNERTKALTISGVNKAELVLLSKCVYRLTNEGKTRTQVTMDVIARWPDRNVQWLAKKVKEISELDPVKDENDSKNRQASEPSDTTAG